MTSPLTRRALIAGAGATISAAALTAAIVPAVTAEEVCDLTIDIETVGLSGLALAAVHIERAVAAMAQPGLAGRWQVTINSGDPDQYWGFQQVRQARLGADGKLLSLFAEWRKTYIEANRDLDDEKLVRLWAIEDSMAKLCPETLPGFACKFLVMTAYDEFDLDSDRAKTLFRDAIAITGQPAPRPIAA